MTKFSALLATGRISNLPTVWCNVLVAFLIVQITQPAWTDTPSSSISITLLLASCIAASCLYVGGCFLGDAVDVAFDKKHKPERPIPQGILSRSSIFSYATFLLTLGITLPNAYIKISTGSLNMPALTASVLLAAAIVIYSLWHKRSPWIGLPFIGACRFFLVLFGGYIAISSSPAIPEGPYAEFRGLLYFENFQQLSMNLAWKYAFCVGLYTICFASVARSESSPNPITWRKSLMAVMLLLPLLPACLTMMPSVAIPNLHLHDTYYIVYNFGASSFTALALYWLWMVTAFRKINTNKGQFVSMSLAGFCLLDATFAAQFGWPWLLICVVLFGLSLLLQKWAPAT